MQKLVAWFDENLLFVLSCFLLIFIPLYPKLPLFDVLPGYIVRVRLEDFFVVFTILVWLIWVIRGKIKISDNPLLKPIGMYLVIGLLSILSALFLTQTVSLEQIHVQKTLLHYFRRIEYFSLFFIFYSSLRSMKQLKIILAVLIGTALLVSFYGFGQKYLYWPAFSTMNREFSKGWMLYLTEHARVLSTFGGHYDLAAFTMMVLIMLWSLFFGVRRMFVKVGIALVIIACFWLLILTVSRTSFLAYLGGLLALFLFWSYRKGLSWAVTRYTVVTVLSIIIMLSLGDLSDRFTKFLRINERFSGIRTLLFSPITAPPKDQAIFLENNPDADLAQITSKSDQPPTPLRPSDVYQDIPLMIPDATGSASVSAVTRTYSKTAYKYDLSTSIRLDALWPMAIAGFKKNLLLGSGYATLNKIQQNDFTEAESTDNDYLRSLGETGALGFIAFYGMLFYMLYIVWRNIPVMRDPILFATAVGTGGLLFGLLINAVYIDVFESSKVAFSFWAISGFTLASVKLVRRGKNSVAWPAIPHLAEYAKSVLHKMSAFIRSDVFFLLVILLIALALRLYKIKTPLADWHSWRQADTASVTRNYVRQGINLLYPTYHDISSIPSGKDNPKGLRMVEFPLYNVASVVIDKLFVGYNLEISSRLTSIFASLGSLMLVFFMTRKCLGRFTSFFAALFFAILPYNIFFSRVILPEPFLVFTSLGMLYFFDKWVEKVKSQKSKVKSFISFFFALLFTISSVLIKPYAAFLFLPMSYLWLRNFGFSLKSVIGLLGYWVIGLLPFIWWRWWIGHFPEGIPANVWLLNGDSIRFKGAFFYWIFADRLSRLILGYWGISLIVLGVLHKTKKEGWFFVLWAIAMLLYVTVFATGNVRHDYYQTLTIPIVIIYLAKGVTFLYEYAKAKRTYVSTGFTAIIIIISMEMFGWYHIRDYYNINHPEIVDAGRAVEQKTRENSLVIAPYGGDTAFLYQTHRVGWPIMQDTVENMIKRGAHYYVSVNFDDQTKQLMKKSLIEDVQLRKYKLIELTDTYVIIQLVPDSKLPK